MVKRSDSSEVGSLVGTQTGSQAGLQLGPHAETQVGPKADPKADPEKILIIGPSWVGDMVMAQSLFIALKRRNPDCEISVLAPAWTRPLLDRMPEVDHSLALPFGHGDLKLLARRRFGRDLREHRFNQAIVLPNSLKSALIPFFANIPLRTGWRGEMRGGLLNDCRRLNKTKLPLMVERFAALAKPPTNYPEKRAASPRLLVSREQVDAALDKFSLQAAANTGRLVALCPGAEFGPSKQWPAQNFARAATDLILLGWHVVIMGSKGDAEVAQEIEQGIATKVGEKLRSRVSNLAGKTDLAEAIDILAACSSAVSNDSGLMHIAAALDLPVVALYGSTSPDFTPPLAPLTRILASDIDCRPCFDRRCRFGHNRCMTEITTDTVAKAVIDFDKK